MNIGFITLRRRYTALMDHIQAIPKNRWHTITPTNISRKYRRPMIVDEETTLPAYPGPLRHILSPQC